MGEPIRASTTDLVRLKAAGYTVERHGDLGWILTDPEGYHLQIGDHGGVAPRQVDAVAEGLYRIANEEAA